MCHADESTAIDRGLDGSHFFGYSLGHYYVFGMHKPGVTDVWQEFQENRERFGFSRAVAAQTGQQLGAQLMEHGLGSLRGAVGTPAQITRRWCAQYEDAGVDQLIFVSQAGRNRHEHICESLELFAREVMPEFHERAEATEKRARPSAWPLRSPPRWPAATRRDRRPPTTPSRPCPSSDVPGSGPGGRRASGAGNRVPGPERPRGSSRHAGRRRKAASRPEVPKRRSRSVEWGR